jgi:peptide subunit release factor RF-3
MLKVEGSTPAIGIHVGLYNAGTIRVGDSVFVGDKE